MISHRSRSGRSTVIRRKPNASFGKILTFSPSSKSPYSRVISSICAAGDLLALLAERLAHLHEVVASIDELDLARDAPGALRLVTTQK